MPNVIEWDGVTCIDGKEKLKFKDGQSYGWVGVKTEADK